VNPAPVVVAPRKKRGTGRWRAHVRSDLRQAEAPKGQTTAFVRSIQTSPGRPRSRCTFDAARATHVASLGRGCSPALRTRARLPRRERRQVRDLDGPRGAAARPPARQGFTTTLMHPSSFFWKTSYMRGASSSPTVCVTRSVVPSGSAGSSTSGRRGSTHRLTLH